MLPSYSTVYFCLLYNESELEIEEHYTDTHGYTEINFAAFAMLGLRFCPRICGVQHQRINRIDPNCKCDPVANGVDTSLLEHVSPIEWDKIVLYFQYILA